MTHFFLVSLLLPASQHSPSWETVNVTPSGALSNADAGSARMSDDGRFVVFETLGTNFGYADTNGTYDVYLRDRALDTVELISKSSAGVIGDARSRWPEVSDDGRFVTFYSEAGNLVAGDTNGAADVFLHDRLLGLTERVSVGDFGLQGDFGVAPVPAPVSDDGNFVAFATYATNLSLLDGDTYADVYRRDRSSDETVLVSVDLHGTDNARAINPSMTADGTRVAFDSNGLVTLLSGGAWRQCYVRDVSAASTTMISVSSLTGFEGSGNSEFPELSDDGSVVAFQSRASDLVAGDLNGTTPDAFVSIGGALELVSLDETGAHTSLGATRAHASDDGRYVVFFCGNSLVSGYSGTGHFLRDRSAGTTELIEIPFPWNATHPTLFSYGARVNEDGTRVLLGTAVYVPGAGGSYNVMMRKRVNGQDGIFLKGSTFGSTGGSVSFTGARAPASAPFYVLRSMKQTGLTYAGHGFDVGSGAAVLGGGTTTASGTFSFSGGPIPGSLAGKTVYVEAAVRAAGTWHDSNLLWLEVF